MPSTREESANSPESWRALGQFTVRDAAPGSADTDIHRLVRGAPNCSILYIFQLVSVSTQRRGSQHFVMGAVHGIFDDASGDVRTPASLLIPERHSSQRSRAPHSYSWNPSPPRSREDDHVAIEDAGLMCQEQRPVDLEALSHELDQLCRLPG